MNEQELIINALLGFALSLLAGTSLAKWFEQLEPNKKRALIGFLSLALAAVVELANCYNSDVCELTNIEQLANVALDAVIIWASSQATHLNAKDKLKQVFS